MYHLLECSQQSLGNNLEEFYAHVHPDDLEMVKNAYNKMLEGIEYDIQYRIITDKGTEKYIHEKTSALYDIDNKPIKVFGIMQDITEQKQIEKHLKEISEHMNQAQMLSGIGSWKYDILEEKFWGSPEMFNIYGSKLENNDGDYTNLLKLIHPDDQPKVQEAINTYLAGKPYEMECRILLNDGSLKYIIAKGLPTVDQDGQVISILGTIQDITEQKRLQQEIEKIQNRFQILVQESNDVFEIIAPDGTIKYVSEALIRWEHPMWGMILLDEFMPLAEETGLIIDIGKWMLRQVCYNYSQWLQKGFPNIKVCIHFSSVQFMENNFEDNILDIIKEFNLNPDFLIMEITESIIMEKKGRFLRAIKKLQSAGIQLAIDDFGKSFSTLAHLHTMNIDIIKIDNFFIQNCMADPKCNIILSAIIDTAKKLKLRVVSEGIETWEQLYYLRELNCYAGQGSLYAGPVPLKEFEKMLATGKCKPVVVNNTPLISREERRKYFRIQFYQLLEASITIKEIQGKKVNVGDTKVLVKNIGPGGLCFLSNIKMPIKKHFIIQCSTQLIGEEIQVCGHLVWAEELEPNIYEYGVEFIIDENERGNLIKILNQVQIKMKKDLLFAEGNFTPYSAKKYFATEIVNL